MWIYCYSADGGDAHGVCAWVISNDSLQSRWRTISECGWIVTKQVEETHSVRVKEHYRADNKDTHSVCADGYCRAGGEGILGAVNGSVQSSWRRHTYGVAHVYYNIPCTDGSDTR